MSKIADKALPEFKDKEDLVAGSGAGAGVLAFQGAAAAQSAVTTTSTTAASGELALGGIELAEFGTAASLAEKGVALGGPENPVADALFAASAVSVGTVLVNHAFKLLMHFSQVQHFFVGSLSAHLFLQKCCTI